MSQNETLNLEVFDNPEFGRMRILREGKVKELSEEYASILTQKKSLYTQYRLSREEMREYQKALHNTEVFFNMDNKDGRDFHAQVEVSHKEQYS